MEYIEGKAYRLRAIGGKRGAVVVSSLLPMHIRQSQDFPKSWRIPGFCPCYRLTGVAYEGVIATKCDVVGLRGCGDQEVTHCRITNMSILILFRLPIFSIISSLIP